MVKQITSKDEFDHELKSAGGKLVVVDFFATWCGPCVAIAPKVDKLAKELSNVVFLKVDVDEDECQTICKTYKIQCMPTFVLLKNGQIVDRLEGADESTLRSLVDKHK